MKYYMVGILFILIIGVEYSSSFGEWRWRDKVAVVTGASSGIGAEIAIQLADKGMTVVALARRLHRLQEVVERTTGKIHPVECDVQKESDIIKAFQWVENTLGGVDVLVNNAGVFIPSPLSTGELDKWKTTFDTNVLGTIISSREALKTMRSRGDDGHIININSLAGHSVLHFLHVSNGIYSASKHAITAISEALSNELSDGQSKIKVTSISPGVIRTEIMTNQTQSDNTSSFHAAMNKVNFITVDAIAEAVIYILSTKPNVHIPELTIKQIGPTVVC